MIFKKKEEETPKPFVPKYYVHVEYGDGRAVNSKYFENEKDAHTERQNIMHEAEAGDWVDVNTTLVRSQSIKSLSVYKTMPRIPVTVVW